MPVNSANQIQDSAPRFSIVIPTFQRYEGLRNCLTGIAAMSSPKTDFEVIIVDDSSAQDPAGVIDLFKPDLDVILLYQDENQGPAAARNQGARQARGKYVVFMDDDCIPCRNWLENFGKHLENQDNAAVGGNCINGLGNSIYSEAQQMLLDFLYAHFNCDPEEARFCPTNNLAVPREAFLKMGGFDTTFKQAGGEDRDFSARWIRTGSSMVFITDAPVYHRHTMGLREFVCMHYRYGRGARLFRVREAEKGVERGFESLEFYARLITFPLSQTTLSRAIVISGLQAVAQVAHMVGYVRELVLTH